MWFARTYSLALAAALCLIANATVAGADVNETAFSADVAIPAPTVAQFFAQHCSQSLVAQAFAQCDGEQLARGALFDYGGARWCAVVLPPRRTSFTEDAAELELDRVKRAEIKAKYLLVKSLKRDTPKDEHGLPRWDDATYARAIQSFACPVAEGVAALVWRETDDLR